MIEESSSLADTRAYFDMIDTPAPIIERATALIDAYARITDIRDADVFISDVIDAEGNRTFPSLWLFMPDAAFEAKISADGGDQIDGTATRRRIVHWVARLLDFDFREARASSRASLEVWFSDEILGDLTATGPNCLRLTEVLRKYIAVNARS
jgi:hypothetical protein